MVSDGYSTCRLPEYGDVVGIAPKEMNVFFNPFHAESLVIEPGIEGVVESRTRREAKEIEPVTLGLSEKETPQALNCRIMDILDSSKYDRRAVCLGGFQQASRVIAIFIDRSAGKPPAKEPDHDRQLRIYGHVLQPIDTKG